MFLLDTSVVAELRKVRLGKADARLAAWAEGLDAGVLYISVITVLELELGVLRMERKDAAQGALLRRWLEEVALPAFRGRIFAVDEAVARACARLHAPDMRGERDRLIAATAMVHGMTVGTRNVGDLAGAGVGVVNPWEAQ